jgi:hypothetical protein
MIRSWAFSTCGLILSGCCCSCRTVDGEGPHPAGFVRLFDGETLVGWKGLVGDPISRAGMSAEELATAQVAADAEMRAHWRVEDGELVSDGQGPNLCTVEEYGDFELLIDWKIRKGGDSGVYLRGSPQVQIWDPWSGDPATQVGSGGLYNNQLHSSTPQAVADHPSGTWNTFRIRMEDEFVSVWLNDVLVVDRVVLENYWDRSLPIFEAGQIELQTHGTETRFRNILIRTIQQREN